MTIVLGAGLTGLAAGMAAGAPVYERSSIPGGICSSYYLRPGTTERLWSAPADGEAYRFELGGGHWVWGGDPTVTCLLWSLAPASVYARRASVYFATKDLYVPYPLQDQLRLLGSEVAAKALAEMARPAGTIRTMKDWLEQHFGPTLCKTFFDRFHDLYTAGLYDRIAPQDAFKSPVNFASALRGAFGEAPAAGYNTSFTYPREGLNALAERMAHRCQVNYSKKAVRIDVKAQAVHFADGSDVSYDRIISTLPLNKALDLTGLLVDEPADPYVSVLVLNVGAIRGQKCPVDHWLYIPDAASGLHRVGFYSNVDNAFVPAGFRKDRSRVSIYVERAYPGGLTPTEHEAAQYRDGVIRELQSWGYIEDVEVVDPTWIDVAYTYSWPQSSWRLRAIRLLQEHSIFQVGRFARWACQGITESFRDGLVAGAALGNHKS